MEVSEDVLEVAIGIGRWPLRFRISRPEKRKETIDGPFLLLVGAASQYETLNLIFDPAQVVLKPMCFIESL